MDVQILDVLKGRFTYSEKAIRDYHAIAAIRLGSSQLSKEQMSDILNNRDNLLIEVLNAPEKKDLLEELKKLNIHNAHLLMQDNINPKMKTYLRALTEEIEHPCMITPSQRLKGAENLMFQYLLVQKMDEEKEHVQNIAKRTLRTILQNWVLYPHLLYDKESCQILTQMLFISNVKF